MLALVFVLVPEPLWDVLVEEAKMVGSAHLSVFVQRTRLFAFSNTDTSARSRRPGEAYYDSQ